MYYRPVFKVCDLTINVINLNFGLMSSIIINYTFIDKQ